MPGEVQVQYIEQTGVSFDELGLEFDDQYTLAGQFVQAGHLSDADASLLREIDSTLLRMSGEQDADLWTAKGVLTAHEWEEVRQLARQFLTTTPTWIHTIPSTR